MQAVTAVQTFNGTELAGRKILVREDREDRDVKQYNKDNGIETPEREFRPPRRERRPRESRPREEGAPRGERRGQENASSGLQVGTQIHSLPCRKRQFLMILGAPCERAQGVALNMQSSQDM